MNGLETARTANPTAAPDTAAISSATAATPPAAASIAAKDAATSEVKRDVKTADVKDVKTDAKADAKKPDIKLEKIEWKKIEANCSEIKKANDAVSRATTEAKAAELKRHGDWLNSAKDETNVKNSFDYLNGRTNDKEESIYLRVNACLLFADFYSKHKVEDKYYSILKIAYRANDEQMNAMLDKAVELGLFEATVEAIAKLIDKDSWLDLKNAIKGLLNKLIQSFGNNPKSDFAPLMAIVLLLEKGIKDTDIKLTTPTTFLKGVDGLYGTVGPINIISGYANLREAAKTDLLAHVYFLRHCLEKSKFLDEIPKLCDDLIVRVNTAYAGNTVKALDKDYLCRVAADLVEKVLARNNTAAATKDSKSDKAAELDPVLVENLKGILDNGLTNTPRARFLNVVLRYFLQQNRPKEELLPLLYEYKDLHREYVDFWLVCWEQIEFLEGKPQLEFTKDLFALFEPNRNGNWGFAVRCLNRAAERGYIPAHLKKVEIDFNVCCILDGAKNISNFLGVCETAVNLICAKVAQIDTYSKDLETIRANLTGLRDSGLGTKEERERVVGLLKTVTEHLAKNGSLATTARLEAEYEREEELLLGRVIALTRQRNDIDKQIDDVNRRLKEVVMSRARLAPNTTLPTPSAPPTSAPAQLSPANFPLVPTVLSPPATTSAAAVASTASTAATASAAAVPAVSTTSVVDLTPA